MNGLDFTKLRNAELLTFGRNFSKIVDLNSASELKVTEERNAFELEIGKLDKLFILSQKSPLTKEVEALDVRRDNAVTGIVGVIGFYTYHHDAAMSAAARLLKEKTDLYGSGIATLGLAQETAQIDSLVQDLKSTAELAAAMELIGIKSWVDELDAANKAFDEKYVARTRELGSAPTENIKDVRVTFTQRYYDLRDMIDGQFFANKKIDPWRTAINELNALIEQYNTTIKRRSTTNDDSDPATDTTPGAV